MSVSSWLVLGILVMSIFMEIGVLFVTNYYENMEAVLEFSSLGG